MQNIERKSRVVIGILALFALFIFVATTFGSSDGALMGTIGVGILISVLLFIESGIVGYIRRSKYKEFSFGDIIVYIGVLTATAIGVFSLSLIPMIGEFIPVAITNFTTIYARIIAVIAMIMALVFVLTPKFE